MLFQLKPSRKFIQNARLKNSDDIFLLKMRRRFQLFCDDNKVKNKEATHNIYKTFAELSKKKEINHSNRKLNCLFKSEILMRKFGFGRWKYSLL